MPDYMSPAFEEHERRCTEAVLRATFGHLDAEPGRDYPGYVVYANTAWGECCLIEAAFDGLEMSPWLFGDLNAFVGRETDDAAVGVWRWQGTFRVFKNGGHRFSKGATECVWFSPEQYDA